IHPIPDSPALHQDDRMMTVLTKWRSRQTEHVTRPHLAQDLFETERGKVMALIDDHLPIFSYDVVHHALAIQALEKRDVDRASRPPATRTDLANIFQRKIQKSRKTFPPLVEELSTMYQYQRVGLSCRNYPGRNHSLSEGRSSGEHSGFMTQKRRYRL